ncbi:MAG: hypothetical protein QF577_07800 [Phycisphaerae bacterium]|nr:hypothetical protein [Phycisphaerae bacterium]MDP7637436.1 hypothetical protein [Phycisphaerae bacterium]
MRYGDYHGIGRHAASEWPVGKIETRAGKFINEAGRDGRFVLYMNDIPYETPPEHVHAVVSLANE